MNSVLRNMARLLSICLITFSASFYMTAQTLSPADAVKSGAERTRGIELFRKQDYENAAKALRAATKKDKQDADAWYYLGLAHSRLGDAKEARKGFERAVKLRPDHFESRFGLGFELFRLNKLSDAEREMKHALSLNPQQAEAHYVLGAIKLRAGEFSKALEEAGYALKVDPSFALALLLKSQSLTGLYLQDISEGGEKNNAEKRAKLKEAEESLERFIQLNPNAIDAASWREQLETLRVYGGLADESSSSRTIFKVGKIEKKAVILAKPEPGFTEKARRNHTTGTVRLRMILAADGQVRHILVVKGLPDGLTESAVVAARRIKFTPAERGGKPVSQVVMVEYHFDIY